MPFSDIFKIKTPELLKQIAGEFLFLPEKPKLMEQPTEILDVSSKTIKPVTQPTVLEQPNLMENIANLSKRAGHNDFTLDIRKFDTTAQSTDVVARQDFGKQIATLPAELEPLEIKGGFEVFGKGLLLLPKQVASSVVTWMGGYEATTVTDRDWGNRLVESAQQDMIKFVEDVTKEYGDKKFVPALSVTEIAQLPQNLSFSIAAWGGGLATAAPLLLLPEPTLITKVAAIGAGMVAAGKIAYEMSAYQIGQEYLETVNQIMQETQGRDITRAEEIQLKKDFERLAIKHSLWEAIPEAIGGGLTVVTLFTPLAAIAKELGLLGLPVRIIIKLAAMYGLELTTEAITQMAQLDVRHEAGLSGGKEVDWLSATAWWSAFKDVAPQTFLITTIMTGVGGASIKINQLIKSLGTEIGTSHPIYNKLKQKISELQVGFTIKDIGKQINPGYIQQRVNDILF